MYDVVIPNKNEKQFIEVAEGLGYKGLCFLYNPKDYKVMAAQKYNTKLEIFAGIICSPKEISKIKHNSCFTVVKANDKVREIIERFNANAIIGLEDHNNSDFLHHRNSGLNHILAKLATKRKIAISFSFSSILNGNRIKLLGRIIQNIKLCQKYKTSVLVGSFATTPPEVRGYSDLISLFSTLGMKKDVVKQGFMYVKKQTDLAKKKKSGKYVREGVEKV